MINKRKTGIFLISILVAAFGYYMLFNKYYGKVDNDVFAQGIIYLLFMGMFMTLVMLGAYIISFDKKIDIKPWAILGIFYGVLMPGYLTILRIIDNVIAYDELVYISIALIYAYKFKDKIKEVLIEAAIIKRDY